MSVKMLLALGFVPVADVPSAFDELVENSTPELASIKDYWEDTCVGRHRRNRRVIPRFPLNFGTCTNVLTRVYPAPITLLRRGTVPFNKQ